MPTGSRVAALLLVLVCGTGAAGDGIAPKFTVERIADGVYAAIRTDPPGNAFESNSVFVVGDDGVLVVDAQSHPGATAELLGALRGITPKPVRWVVNTHWHFDHNTGNTVYRDSFPGVELIAHEKTREAMATEGVRARREFAASLPEVMAFFQGLLDRNESLDGSPLTEEERTSFRSDLELARGYATVPGDFAPALPTRTFDDQLTLPLGGRSVELLFLGRAHTAGDIVVHLPEDGIVVAGDLVDWPIPLVGTTSFPVDFGPTLERLLALRPRLIVPGHGPVLRDDAHVRSVVALLTDVREQTAAAVARGETLEQARKSVDLSAHRTRFAGESRLRGNLFDAYVSGPGVARAYEQLTP